MTFLDAQFDEIEKAKIMSHTKVYRLAFELTREFPLAFRDPFGPSKRLAEILPLTSQVADTE